MCLINITVLEANSMATLINSSPLYHICGLAFVSGIVDNELMAASYSSLNMKHFS